MKHIVPVLPTLICAALLTLNSCQTRITPDPIYTRNYAAIQDIEYPANKIVGQWGRFGGNSFTDSRVYLLIRPDGSGTDQVWEQNENDVKPIVFELEFTWRYDGKNRWTAHYPTQAAKLVSLGPGRTSSTRMSERVSKLRFHEGRLYEENCPNTFVPLTDEAVRQQLAHIRSLFQ
jgi:hypothetical protein